MQRQLFCSFEQEVKILKLTLCVYTQQMPLGELFTQTCFTSFIYLSSFTSVCILYVFPTLSISFLCLSHTATSLWILS